MTEEHTFPVVLRVDYPQDAIEIEGVGKLVVQLVSERHQRVWLEFYPAPGVKYKLTKGQRRAGGS